MTSQRSKASRVALLGAASLIVLAACGGGGSSPIAQEGSSSAARSVSSPAAQEIELDSNTTWQEVFNTFSASEQECIRGDLNDDQFQSAMEETVLGYTSSEEWDNSTFRCLDVETARGLILSTTIAFFESEEIRSELGVGLDFELGDDEKSCLQEWVSDMDPAALAADDDDAGAFEIGLGMFACVPDLLIAFVAQGLGVSPDELSDEEKSCLQDWARNIDSAALAADEDDPAAIEAGFGMFECVPDLLVSGIAQDFEDQSDESTSTGPDDHADWPEDATFAAVDTAIEGTIEHLWDIDFFAFQAEAGATYQIDVTPVTMSDPYVTLYMDYEELDYSDDYEGLAPRIYWEAPSSDTYYVAVEGYDEGTYTLLIAAQ